MTLLVVAYAIASRVDFYAGAGYTVPTQLVFVPMLFLLPTTSVPLFVAAGFLVGKLPDYLGKRAHPERAVLCFGDAWHALGPALVLSLAGAVEPTSADLLLYIAALASQFGLDLAAGTSRDWLALGVAPRVQLGVLGW